MPWDTSAVTCSIAQEGTSSAHRRCLQRVRESRVMEWATAGSSYRQRRTSQGIQWLAPDWQNYCSAGDATIRVVEEPLRDWDRARVHACKRPLRYRTTVTVISTTTVKQYVRMYTYVFLLFVDMADLEPNVLFSQGRRR